MSLAGLFKQCASLCATCCSRRTLKANNIMETKRESTERESLDREGAGEAGTGKRRIKLVHEIFS